MFRAREEKVEKALAGLRGLALDGLPIDPAMLVECRAASIANAMALLHGGDWKVRIDPQEGLVMIVRRGRRQTL